MTEAWYDECRRLRAEGLSQRDISIRLNKPSLVVRMALNESEEQKIAIRRAREQARHRAKPRNRRAEKKNASKFQTYWTARAAATQTITPDIKREAILAFSKHEIDRTELMLRITPRDKWSKAGLLRVE